MAHLALVGGKPLRQKPSPRWPGWDTADIDAITAVIESGRWGADWGTEARAFEKEFAAYQNAAQAWGSAWRGR